MYIIDVFEQAYVNQPGRSTRESASLAANAEDTALKRMARNEPGLPTRQALERLAAGLDRQNVADEFGPLTLAARELWQRARRKRARPRRGAGAKRISVTIEKGLLTQADRLARELSLKRSELLSLGVSELLRRRGA